MLMWSLSTMSVHGQGWYAGTPTRMKETGNVHYSPLSVTLVRRIYAGGKKNILGTTGKLPVTESNMDPLALFSYRKCGTYLAFNFV